jgi:hypothetical protein
MKKLRQKSKVKKLTDLERLELLGINPLAGGDFRILVRKLEMGGSYKIGDEGVLLPVEVDVESESYIKMYCDRDKRLLIANLSNGAMRLYMYIMFSIDYGKDWVEIGYRRYMEENGVKSINTYKSSLAELCRYLFVYPSLVDGVYWINPRLFFKGSRVNKYPKNVFVK